MKVKTFYFFIPLILQGIFSCQTNNSKTEADLKSIDLLRGEITMCGSQLGEVNFMVPCSKESQESFNLGLSLLHSFEYEEAEKAFVKTIDRDPTCVMAYWGVAMSNFHSLWLQAGTKHLEKGARILQIAQTLPKSEQEQDYINAIQVFYTNWDSLDHNTRKSLFAKKMEELYMKYPDDKEAAIFYALALDASSNPSDKDYTNQKKAGKILESLLENHPNHPGIVHYIIHTYDYPELAPLALTTARRYAQIAPASAHAQHMPSHIFTRLGLWEESILSNTNSVASAICYGQSIDSTGHWDEELHGMDYLVYAYLQIGDNGKAKEQLDRLQSFKKIFPVNFKVAYASAAIPSRIALENRDWKEAATLAFSSAIIDWENFPWEKSILHFTRAIGMIRSGDIASAENERAELQRMQEKLAGLGDMYKANQVKIQLNSVQAWLYLAAGKKREALLLMEEAAKMEYNTSKHSVTPGEIIPAGELLGDMLMQMNNPAKALEAYEFDLKQHPNRFNELYGAAKAAVATKDKQKATHYFEQLLLQTKNSKSNRREILEATTSLEGYEGKSGARE